MNCPACGANDPTPPPSDDGTTTCPRCGHRFPVDEKAQAVMAGVATCVEAPTT